MNTPTDPLAALKKASPGDPIIPALEHLIRHSEAMQGDARAIARDAASLRNTRVMVFLVACLLSAGAASAATWYALRGNPAPEIQILRRAGVEVRITDANEEVKLTLGGRIPAASHLPPTATSQGALILTWPKEQP